MEGPSLKILREELKPFIDKRVLHVSGNTKQPKEKLKGASLKQIDTWGKMIFFKFVHGEDTITFKTHFMMFGSYRIDDPKPNRDPRLELKFETGTIYFYACAIQIDVAEYWAALDKKIDLMSKTWSQKHVVKLLQQKKNPYLCDLFLDQTVFAGSGNIVKNEVLFNLRCHPFTRLKSLSLREYALVAKAIWTYCQNFYRWKKKFQLRRHWQVYRQYHCPLCKKKLERKEMGQRKRKTFFCPQHQPLKRKGKLILHKVLPIRPANRAGPKKEARLDH